MHSLDFPMGNAASSSRTDAAAQKIVVVGGGYAGRSLVHLLDTKCNIIWIERRPCLLHKMLVRSTVSASWIDAGLVPNCDLSARATLVQANVTSIDLQNKKVMYFDGQQDIAVEYDVLIVASGATNRSPAEPAFSSMASAKREDMVKHFESVGSRISTKKNILVVGGGPVGCELAAEIKAKYPHIAVTVASSSPTLCANMRVDSAGSEKIQRGLEGFGIRVLLNKRVELSPEEAKQEMIEFDPPRDLGDAGKEVDLVIVCAGSVPNTQFMPGAYLTDSGRHIKVNEYLQVADSVFAIGDCNDVPEPKLFVTAGTKKFMFGMPVGQADIVAKNVLTLRANKPMTAYKPANTAKGKVMLPLGPKGGIGVNVPNIFVKMKAKNYFYPAHWKFGKSSLPKMLLD